MKTAVIQTLIFKELISGKFFLGVRLAGSALSYVCDVVRVCSPDWGGLRLGSGRDYRQGEKIDLEDRCVWAPLETVRICHQPDQEPGQVTTQRKNQLRRPEESRRWTEKWKLIWAGRLELSKHFLNNFIKSNFCFKEALKKQSLKYESWVKNELNKVTKLRINVFFFF